MKKLVITLSLLAGATAGYSQGQLNWSDYQGAAGGLPAFSISVFEGTAGGPSGGPGNTSSDLPPGTATYTGAPLSAAGEMIGLYDGTTAAAAQNAVATGTPIATDTFNNGNAFPGRWDVTGSLTATDGANPSGTAVFVELAAWSGGFSSYAAALASGTASTGLSGVSSGSTTLGGGGTPPAVSGTLAGIGLQSFSLVPAPTPEPSTIALGVIGASTFLMRLRRKQ
jgi:hypothetical protein